MENQYLRTKITESLGNMPEPTRFEAICEDYLRTFPEYKDLVTTGRNIMGKIKSSVCDSLMYEPKTGHYYAFAYSTVRKKDWKRKAKESIKEVKEYFKKRGLKCKRIIICTNQEAGEDDQTELGKYAKNVEMEFDLHHLIRIRDGIIDLPILLYRHFSITPQIKHFELLDKKLKSRKGLLPNFPKLEDFENGLVFMEKRKAYDVLEVIEDKNMCLLYGKPAAGKTVFAFAFGRFFSETYLSYYLDIKGEFDSAALLREMIINNSSQILFIIDNCHMWPETVYNLIKLIETNNIKTKILFISRGIKSFLGEGENYFEVLKGCTIPIVANETVFKNIISLYENYRCKGLSHYTSKRYDANAIMNKCGQDLFILSYFLDAWNPEKTGRSLDEVKEEEIFDRISEKYLEPYDRKIERNNLLVSLSALYQFEFPIESPFFYSQIANIPKDEREGILNEGLIEVQEAKDERLYFLPHSTFASLVLKTVEKKNKWLLKGKSAYDYTKEACLEYLEIRPKHILNIVKSFSSNGRKDIAKSYCESDYFAEKMSERLSAVHFTPLQKWLEFLTTLEIDQCYKEKVFDDEVIRQVAGKLGGDTSFQSFAWFLKRLVEFDKSISKTFFEDLDSEVVGARLKEEKSINIIKFFERAAEVAIGPEKCREILASAMSESFLLRIEEGSLVNLGFLLWYLNKIDKSLSLNLYVLGEFTAQRLSQMFKKKEKVNIKNIGRIFEYADVDFIREFTTCFDEEFFHQCYNRSTLSQVGKFMFNYALYCPICKSSYERFERQDLHRKLQDSRISDIQKFISRIGKTKYIGRRLAEGAIRELERIDIKRNISLAPTTTEDIDMLINTVGLFDDPYFIVHQLKDVLNR